VIDFGGAASASVEDEPSAHERLELADWRRRISDLYAEVRATSARDPEAAWRHWREVREELFRAHSQSPVPAAQRDAFRAHHWPYDPRYRLEATLADVPAPSPGASSAGPAAAPGLGGLSLNLPISTGGVQSFARIGFLEVPFPEGKRMLGLYWMAGYAGGLFLPFRDASNGTETYGAGRYLLDAAKSADLGTGATPETLVLDFNFSFQPSCAFDPKWACPLSPPENRLDIRVEAGERIA
jgi:uncharacterized protein (DUF1684 family)